MAFKLAVILAAILLAASAPVPEESNNNMTTLASAQSNSYLIETDYEVIKLDAGPVDDSASTAEADEAIGDDEEVKTSRDTTSDEASTPEQTPEEAETPEQTSDEAKKAEATKDVEDEVKIEEIAKHEISKRSALRSEHSNNDLLAAGDALKYDSVGESSLIGHKIRFLPTWAG